MKHSSHLRLRGLLLFLIDFDLLDLVEIISESTDELFNFIDTPA
jgi:hypothetical protein